jgi:hypothetical protein
VYGPAQIDVAIDLAMICATTKVCFNSLCLHKKYLSVQPAAGLNSRPPGR